MNGTMFLIYFLLTLFTIFYSIFAIIGAIKLARAKKYTLFVIGFLISIVWLISGFLKIKEKR